MDKRVCGVTYVALGTMVEERYDSTFGYNRQYAGERLESHQIGDEAVWIWPISVKIASTMSNVRITVNARSWLTGFTYDHSSLHRDSMALRR